MTTAEPSKFSPKRDFDLGFFWQFWHFLAVFRVIMMPRQDEAVDRQLWFDDHDTQTIRTKLNEDRCLRLRGSYFWDPINKITRSPFLTFLVFMLFLNSVGVIRINLYV